MKLHVGCSTVAISGYTNIDIRFLPHVDVVDNAEYLRQFEGKNISDIYVCHVLEHFCRWRIPAVLSRWFDLLQPGGKLFLSVPDFEAVVDYYTKTKDLPSLMGLLYGGQDYAENFHCTCWDFSAMKSALEKAGFMEISRYNWKEYFNGFDDYSKCYLPHMDIENGMLMSLNVMASKPITPEKIK